MYFRLGFSHRFTSPILLYIVGKMTGIDFSCSDIQWTPKEWRSWLDINDNSFKLRLEMEILLNENFTSPKYSEMDIFSAPFFFSGVHSKFGQYGDMIWWWWYDDDDDWWWWWWWISLKKLRKSHCVEDRPPQSLHSCQNRVDSTWRACHGPSRVTKTSASWVNSSLRLHSFCAVLF